MHRIAIETMIFGADGFGHLDGRAVLVHGGAPGDVIETDEIEEHPDYARVRSFRLHASGGVRRRPPCEYLPRCGGCDWQHLTYDAQLKHKAMLLAENFRRGLEVEVDENHLIEPSPAEFGYRSRVRLKVDQKGLMGYYESVSNRLVPIQSCLLTTGALDTARRLAHELSCAEIEIVRRDDRQVLIAHDVKWNPRATAAAGKAAREAAVAGVIVRGGGQRHCLGNVAISYAPEPGCEIIVDADSFSQVNPAQNRKLVAAMMEMASLQPEDAVLDLFCGAGNFSLPAARRGATVLGVDGDERAIGAARTNAQRMGLRTTQFIAMDAAESGRFLRRARYRPRVLILDPPRRGAAALIDCIAELRAEKLLYVSCDPPSLIRDLRLLRERGYQVARVRGFDFFPQTHHIEALVEVLLT